MPYPFKLDLARGRVLQIELDEAAIRAASFLDERILTPATKGGWTPLQAYLAQRPASLQPPLPVHFIFHTGHVGSTLVSRLIDEATPVLSLREPLPLRALAEVQDVLDAAPLEGAVPALTREQFSELLTALLWSWRRGFQTTAAVIIKATSSVARLAPVLLDAAPESRAIYLNLRAESWLATLLAGENSPIDLRGHAPERLRRLARQRRLPPLVPEALSPGELAALSWLAETTTQQEVLSKYQERVLAVDFDAFLTDARSHLTRILEHFGLPVEPAAVVRALSGPVMTRYSKAPEHPYDPDLRAAVAEDSRRRNRGEIVKGLRLLERLLAAGQDPQVVDHIRIRF